MARLLIAASGTGGHLFPALAVGNALPSSWTIFWLGANRLENKLVPKRFNQIKINANGLQGNFLKKLIELINLIIATGRVFIILHQKKIDLVFTTGGYISAPTILGARILGIPVLLHESNAIPGKVTRLLGGFCKVVAIGQPLAANKYFKNKQTILTGTPLRKAFLKKQPIPEWVPLGNGPLLLVIGGSQGALGLNQMIRPLLPSLLKAGCRIIHLTGKNDPHIGQQINPNYIKKEFSDEVSALMQHSDLAISRAGAVTLNELAISGLPAILVPYPKATDNHQEANAGYFSSKGAAVIVHQHPPQQSTLKQAIWYLIKTKTNGKATAEDPLEEMRKNMQSLAKPNATQKLVGILKALN